MATEDTNARRGVTKRWARPTRAGAVWVGVAALIAGLLGSTPAQAVTGRQDWGAAAQFVGQINSERASHGHARLTVSSALSSVAASWAAGMARSNRLGHNPRLAGSVSGWRVLAENVGVGPSVSSLQSAFYGSAEHRANMLDPSFTMVGVAVVDVGDKLWVVEDFEQPAHAKPTASRHSSRYESASGASDRAKQARGQWPTALMRARMHQLRRLFVARHNLVLPGLTAHTARQRT